MLFLALGVTAKFNQAGEVWGTFSVSISTVWPLSNGTLSGANLLFILQALQWWPTSVWTAYAKSMAVDPPDISIIFPWGVNTYISSGKISVFTDSINGPTLSAKNDQLTGILRSWRPDSVRPDLNAHFFAPPYNGALHWIMDRTPCPETRASHPMPRGHYLQNSRPARHLIRNPRRRALCPRAQGSMWLLDPYEKIAFCDDGCWMPMKKSHQPSGHGGLRSYFC